MRAMLTAKGVPVLFALSGDPVELGIAQSFAAPGGNFTGSTFLSLEVAAKRVEIIKEAAPRLRRLAVLADQLHPGEQSELRETREAARTLGLESVYCPFKGGAELDSALAAIRDARADAMITFPDGPTMVNRVKVAQFAIGQSLPSMFGWSEYCDAGGFMSYGANQRATYFRLADYADRLLRGAKPAELPIAQPTAFELVVNLKTAKAIGVTIPPSILVRADRTIE
jgi:putative ABC transport system substrate-binding protein